MSFTGRWYAWIAAVLVVAGVIFLWRHRGGVAVSVVNDESFALTAVEVRTSAGAYPLGDLQPGGSASTLVGAKGESSVRLSWIAGGSTHESDADVYFEGSPDGTGMYGGEVAFVVSGGAARSSSHVRSVIHLLSRGTPPAAR